MTTTEPTTTVDPIDAHAPIGIPAVHLRTALDALRHHARPASDPLSSLTGIHVDPADQTVTLAATDSYTLLVVTLPAAASGQTPTFVLAPATIRATLDALQPLRPTWYRDDPQPYVWITPDPSPSRITAVTVELPEGGPTLTATPCLDSEFPDYQAILDKVDHLVDVPEVREDYALRCAPWSLAPWSLTRMGKTGQILARLDKLHTPANQTGPHPVTVRSFGPTRPIEATYRLDPAHPDHGPTVPTARSIHMPVRTSR